VSKYLSKSNADVAWDIQLINTCMLLAMYATDQATYFDFILQTHLFVRVSKL